MAASLTREMLLEHLDALRAGEAKMLDDIIAQRGGIQVAEQLLQQLDALESAPSLDSGEAKEKE